MFGQSVCRKIFPNTTSLKYYLLFGYLNLESVGMVTTNQSPSLRSVALSNHTTICRKSHCAYVGIEVIVPSHVGRVPICREFHCAYVGIEAKVLSCVRYIRSKFSLDNILCSNLDLSNQILNFYH